MCGRFAVAIPKKFTSFLGVDLSLLKILRMPRYNVAPGQEVLVLTEHQGEITPITITWGFPPPDWMTGFTKKVINARSESIDTKPMFRDSFAHRRCLVLASGFYEWKKKQTKIPYYFYLSNVPLFCMAGIYATLPEDGYQGMAILTATPNETVSPIHDRMPVILDEGQCRSWINTETAKEVLLNLLKPYPSSAMKSHIVSNRINSPTYDGEDLIAPADEQIRSDSLY